MVYSLKNNTSYKNRILHNRFLTMSLGWFVYMIVPISTERAKSNSRTCARRRVHDDGSVDASQQSPNVKNRRNQRKTGNEKIAKLFRELRDISRCARIVGRTRVNWIGIARGTTYLSGTLRNDSENSFCARKKTRTSPSRLYNIRARAIVDGVAYDVLNARGNACGRSRRPRRRRYYYTWPSTLLLHLTVDVIIALDRRDYATQSRMAIRPLVFRVRAFARETVFAFPIRRVRQLFATWVIVRFVLVPPRKPIST